MVRRDQNARHRRKIPAALVEGAQGLRVFPPVDDDGTGIFRRLLDLPVAWNADGWRFGVAGQWAFKAAGGADWLITADGEYRTLVGEAFQDAIGGVIFTTDESQIDLALDTRVRFGGGWLLGGRAELKRGQRDRRDLFAEATSNIRGIEGGGALKSAASSAEASAFPPGFRSQAMDRPAPCLTRIDSGRSIGASWVPVSRSTSTRPW